LQEPWRGAISIGVGAYLSSKSEQEVVQKETQRKGIKKRKTPEEETRELVQFYRAKGFKEEAEAIARKVYAKMELQAEYTAGEEVGLTSEESWPPSKAGILTGLSFASKKSCFRLFEINLLTINPTWDSSIHVRKTSPTFSISIYIRES
jgi:VIT1/CCC1 family predicted Fe2+/Mn2+ transporter